MNLDLHIERIIVEGISLGPAQRDQLRAALETELAERLQACTALAPGLDHGIAVPDVHAAPARFDSLAPCHIAAQVAESVAAATLAPPPPPPSPLRPSGPRP